MTKRDPVKEVEREILRRVVRKAQKSDALWRAEQAALRAKVIHVDFSPRPPELCRCLACPVAVMAHALVDGRCTRCAKEHENASR